MNMFIVENVKTTRSVVVYGESVDEAMQFACEHVNKDITLKDFWDNKEDLSSVVVSGPAHVVGVLR